MINGFTVACIQINTKNVLDTNLIVTEALVREAKARGVHLVLMPENIAFIPKKQRDTIYASIPTIIYLALVSFRSLSSELRLWLHCGSLMVHVGNGRIMNRTYFLLPSGKISVTYDKIHMFDADLEDIYRESSVLISGNRIVTANTPWGKIGLSICYDLRFSQLYYILAHHGAILLTVPSAFTQMTGLVHWQALLQARAIENSCYVFAPAQTGVNANNRKTYGHTLVIDPWGRILANSVKSAPSLALSRVDLETVRSAREKIPTLKHDYQSKNKFSLSHP